jgi:HAD superfamily hydrolase (TIGR01549 family)
MFQAYIFDLEGTLVDFQYNLEPSITAAKLRLEEMGFSKERLLEIKSFYELFNEAMKDALLGRVNLPAYEVKKGIAEVWESFDFDALSRWQLSEGVKDSLTELHSSAKIGLFTTMGWKAAKKALEKFEIDGLFHIMATRDDVTLLKPHGEGLRLILKCFDISGEEAIYVGDTTRDILAAKEVGIKSGFIVGGEQKLPDLLTEPDYILYSFSDILEIEMRC